jgi:outer membrane protein OmpA-like peptidoglycan-associated protein
LSVVADSAGAAAKNAQTTADQAQSTADVANQRINALDDYDVLKTFTVHFKSGSAVLSAAAKTQLDEAVSDINENLKGWLVVVEGYADSRGNTANNRSLSERRANAVINYLVTKHDLPIRRVVQPFGYGSLDPIATNTSRSGRSLNRRAEITVLVNQGISSQSGSQQTLQRTHYLAGLRNDERRLWQGTESKRSELRMACKNNVQLASRLCPCTAQRWVVRLVLVITLFVTAAAINSASAQTSVLQGTVSVTSSNGPGDRLPGASLTLAPADQGKTTQSTVTNDQGEYKFTNLTTGLYTLQVDLNGFKQYRQGVTIRPGITTLENIALELEGLSGSVTVVADGDELNTTEPTQSLPHSNRKHFKPCLL